MKNKSNATLSKQQLTDIPFRSAGVTIDVSRNSIQRDGEVFTVQPKVLELLVLLCSSQGRTLSKDELSANLWPDVIVGPESLANCMARLRKALDDAPKNPTYIQTVQRKGYRWIQPVELVAKSSFVHHKTKFITAIAITVCLAGLYIWRNSVAEKQPEQFIFPDLSIKKLPDGGYEIAAGVEGEMTPEKKAALIEEIKRITREEDSGMEFTFDSLTPTCSHDDEKSTTKTDCIKILPKER